MADYVLFEEATGYALFKVGIKPEDIGSRLKEVQDAATDLGKFGKMVELVSFTPFKGAAQALENANDISEGIVNEYLKSFLELNLPKASKKSKVSLGISDKNLGQSIKDSFPYVDTVSNEGIQDLIRGIRLFGDKLLKGLEDGDLERAQLGLGHAYSRSKVKFSVTKNDNHIIQAIALLDQLDKDINIYAMRIKEWYGWHFPELKSIVPDNHDFAALVCLIRNKSTLDDDKKHDIAALVNDDEAVAENVIAAAKISMGSDLSETDMECVVELAERVVEITEFRAQLYAYLTDKMHTVAPNLSELIGEMVGARLISHAGSLINLSKYPASTVQILGAEKALFRALKTKGNTPKYGLIYHSSFISKAGAKNKGRISRFLANKCSIASRIDSFANEPTNVFGQVLKQQMEERLQFFETGKPPIKNVDAMNDALSRVKVQIDQDEDVEMIDEELSEEEEKEKKEKKKEKKDKKDKKDKKEKKEKKEKKRSSEDGEETPKKKKSKK
ncbi:Nucleolar protein 56 [Wickerhamiella sorbophila]|uniref:Nucleolar protein 56 n=1 Tax=Wickerhamiella sorbophila TaxID=45607 RepID=A0A2T0FDQ7_9ASCO|nr:Nucleolar protein 56 [Wickerhamiella sorbophila]PRT53111.1 Nucleolar protein 56 [Wickerhamiella sorbophila]